MPDTTVTALPPAPLHAIEIWSKPRAVAERFAAIGLPLPAPARSVARDGLILIRFEPTVWLVEGNAASLESLLEDDGSLTAIGGGIVRVRLSGPGWRTLLMEGGLFDAESAGFNIGCSAATIIDHVAVRLLVESEEACLVYVPASYAAGLIEHWEQALPLLAGEQPWLHPRIDQAR